VGWPFLKCDDLHGIFAIWTDPLFGHVLRLAAHVLLTSRSFVNNISVNYVIYLI